MSSRASQAGAAIQLDRFVASLLAMTTSAWRLHLQKSPFFTGQAARTLGLSFAFSFFVLSLVLRAAL
jgi:hypothetical protein